MQLDSYPLPRIEELFASLSGGKHFAQAYLQIELEESKQYITINNIVQSVALWGFISPINFSAVHGKTIERIPRVSVYVDDII